MFIIDLVEWKLDGNLPTLIQPNKVLYHSKEEIYSEIKR